MVPSNGPALCNISPSSCRDAFKLAVFAEGNGEKTAHVQSSYRDAPQPIGYNATISAPHMHATCLEILKDHLLPGNKVFFINCFSSPPTLKKDMEIPKEKSLVHQINCSGLTDPFSVNPRQSS